MVQSEQKYSSIDITVPSAREECDEEDTIHNVPRKSPNTSLKASKTTKSLLKSSQRSKKRTDEQRHTNSSFKGKIPLGPLVHYGPLLLREKLASKTPATMRSSDQNFMFSAKKGSPGGPL